MNRLAVLSAFLLLLACGPKEVIVTMNAQNNSGQSGVATVIDRGARTEILIVIHKSDFPENQPVHLHPGRCGEIGVRTLPASNNPVMAVGLPDMRDPANPNGVDNPPPSDGGVVFTRALIELPFKELTNGDWVLNVHDRRDLALYVACGNIN